MKNIMRCLHAWNWYVALFLAQLKECIYIKKQIILIKKANNTSNANKKIKWNKKINTSIANNAPNTNDANKKNT